MKKLVIVCVIFALVIGMGIAETIYTYGVYDEIYVTLTEVKESIGAEFGQDTLPLTQKAVKKWKDNKEILFCLGNHNVLRTVDEKLTSLGKMVEIDYVDDAKVNLDVCLSLIEAVRNDNVPNLTNMS